ncbi:MAG: hypothetical protein HZA90_06755 [Verrucomicrobia bacterium]|nr:hypothetical protein [Verrucomicrobiota bacterium]
MKSLLNMLSHRLPKPYRERTPELSQWSARYGECETKLVKEFLDTFCQAFQLGAHEAELLLPDDKPLEIYERIYRFGGPDELEFETLVSGMQGRYGVGVGYDVLKTATLASLYELTRTPAKKSPLKKS